MKQMLNDFGFVTLSNWVLFNFGLKLENDHIYIKSKQKYHKRISTTSFNTYEMIRYCIGIVDKNNQIANGYNFKLNRHTGTNTSLNFLRSYEWHNIFKKLGYECSVFILTQCDIVQECNGHYILIAGHFPPLYVNCNTQIFKDIKFSDIKLKDNEWTTDKFASNRILLESNIFNLKPDQIYGESSYVDRTKLWKNNFAWKMINRKNINFLYKKTSKNDNFLYVDLKIPLFIKNEISLVFEEVMTKWSKLKLKPIFYSFFSQCSGTVEYSEIIDCLFVISKKILKPILSFYNFKVLKGKLSLLVKRNAYEVITLEELLRYFRIDEFGIFRGNGSWHDGYVKHKVVGRLLLFLFNEVFLPIMSYFFYSTRIAGYKHKMFYIMRRNWNTSVMRYFEKYKHNLVEDVAGKHVGYLKFMMKSMNKGGDFRTICDCSKTKGNLSSVNRSFRNILPVIKEMICKNFDVLSFRNILWKLERYIRDYTSKKHSNKYIVKFDLVKCFDNIRKSELLRMISEIVENKQYFSSEYKILQREFLTNDLKITTFKKSYDKIYPIDKIGELFDLHNNDKCKFNTKMNSKDEVVNHKKIKNYSISEKEIKNYLISENEIKNYSISENEIKNYSISENEIKNYSISENEKEIKNYLISEKEIKNYSISENEKEIKNYLISEKEIKNSKISENEISEKEIKNYSISEKEIKNYSISEKENEIKNYSISENEISEKEISEKEIKNSKIYENKNSLINDMKNTSKNKIITSNKIYREGIVKECGHFVYTGEEIKRLLEEIILQMTIHYGGKYYRTIEGIPQGWCLSPILCNLYMSYIEKKYLNGILKKGRMFRYVDDFLLISPDINEIYEFFSVIKRLKNMGIFVNFDKIETNLTNDENNNLLTKLFENPHINNKTKNEETIDENPHINNKTKNEEAIDENPHINNKTKNEEAIDENPHINNKTKNEEAIDENIDLNLIENKTVKYKKNIKDKKFIKDNKDRNIRSLEWCGIQIFPDNKKIKIDMRDEYFRYGVILPSKINGKNLFFKISKLFFLKFNSHALFTSSNPNIGEFIFDIFYYLGRRTRIMFLRCAFTNWNFVNNMLEYCLLQIKNLAIKKNIPICSVKIDMIARKAFSKSSVLNFNKKRFC